MLLKFFRLPYYLKFCVPELSKRISSQTGINFLNVQKNGISSLKAYQFQDAVNLSFPGKCLNLKFLLLAGYI